MSRLIKAAFIAAALILTACGADPSVMEDYKPSALPKVGHDVQISRAYIKPPFTGRTTSAAFFLAENKGADATLVAASSPIAEVVEIHTHLEEDGIMKMRRVEGVDMPSGETVEFRPGSYHIMMFNTVLSDDQTEVPVTLSYADGTEVTIMMEIGDGPED